MLDLLLVIPTLNEEKNIKEIIPVAQRILKKNFKKYAIVVVDAESTDGTVQYVKSVMKSESHIQLMTGKRHNRGADVMKGFSWNPSRLYCYIDADLRPTIGYLPRMAKAIDKGNDLVTGSRYLEGSMLHRPKLRLLVSLFYNNMIHWIFHDGVTDHQCGFKMFDRRALEMCKRYCKETHWAWDTEAILVCKQKNLRVLEIPIYWAERRSKNTNLKRLVNDILMFIPSVIGMYVRLR